MYPPTSFNNYQLIPIVFHLYHPILYPLSLLACTLDCFELNYIHHMISFIKISVVSLK